MNLLALLALVGLAACQAEADAPTPAAERPAPVLALPVELADVGGLAARMWRSVGYDVPAPTVTDDALPARSIRVTVAHGIITCDGQRAWGCTHRTLDLDRNTWIEISDAVPNAWQASTVAHELGHALGLEHTDEQPLAGVMSPDRTEAQRARPCVGLICLYPEGE